MKGEMQLITVGPFRKEGSTEPTQIVIQHDANDVRRVQVSFWVSGDEYCISSNVVECSVKGAELAVELLTALFSDPVKDNSAGS